MTLEEKAKELKYSFLRAIDGGYSSDPIDDNIDSYIIGVCKLDFDGTDFHVHLRRPGLLIGSKGKTLDALQKYLGVPIHIHEVILTK